MLRRLGFPDVSHHRRLLAALGVDALGSGVFMPISVLYFLAATPLRLPTVGLAISLAELIAVPFVLVMGQLVDRFGARPVMLAANAAQALGYAGYLTVGRGTHTIGPVLAVTMLVAIGQAGFWGSYLPLVAAIAPPGERELWFGALDAVRNTGFAVGGLLAALVISIGSAASYRGLVLANVASYLAALLLLALPMRAGHRTAGRAEPAGAGAWRTVLRDRPYYLVVGATTCYALCALALNLAIPVYAVTVLHLPGWITGLVYAVNTVMISFGQAATVRKLLGRSRYRVIMAGCGALAAGFALFALADVVARQIAGGLVLAAVVVYTVGELTCDPVLTAIAVESRPEQLRGRYSSLFQLSWNVALVLAPVTYSWLLALGGAQVWAAMVAITAFGAGFARLMARHLPFAAAPITNAGVEPEPQPV